MPENSVTFLRPAAEESNEDAVALLNLIQAEARQDDVTNRPVPADEQNAILVAAALTHVMEHSNLPEHSVMATNQLNTVITIEENQAQNILALIRQPPPPPPQLILQQDILPQRIIDQPQTRTNEVLLPLVYDAHEPPAGLNQKQQHAYRLMSVYLSNESRRRARLLAGFEQAIAPPLLLIHGAPGTGKSFVVQSITNRAHE